MERYSDFPGFHRHRCEECLCVWVHKDGSDDKSHKCPHCGHKQFAQYKGIRPPSEDTMEPVRIRCALCEACKTLIPCKDRKFLQHNSGEKLCAGSGQPTPDYSYIKPAG